jgi:hypothetical protein
MFASTLRKFGGGGGGDSSPPGRSQASTGSSWQLLGAAAGGVGVGGASGNGSGSSNSSGGGGNDAGARVISHTIVESPMTAAAGTSVGDDRTPTFSQPSSSADLAANDEEGEGEAAATAAATTMTTPTTTRFRPPGLDDDNDKPGARSTACGVIATGAVLVVMALVATVRGPLSSGRA